MAAAVKVGSSGARMFNATEIVCVLPVFAATTEMLALYVPSVRPAVLMLTVIEPGVTRVLGSITSHGSPLVVAV